SAPLPPLFSAIAPAITTSPKSPPPAGQTHPDFVTGKAAPVTARLVRPDGIAASAGSARADGGSFSVSPAAGCVGAEVSSGLDISSSGAHIFGSSTPSVLASAATLAVARSKRSSGSTAVALKNQPSNAAGSDTPPRSARLLAGSSTPRT